jgi:hypothetical protein
MKLTNGISKDSLLFQFGFCESKIGIAINAKNEIVECISYDKSSAQVKEAVFTSMIYNGWTEDGKRQSAYKYAHPKALYNDFKFVELTSEAEQKRFLATIEF